MSVAEIAQSMGITQTNVKVRLLRARRKLAALLEEGAEAEKRLREEGTHEL
jgi:DNA-directed RNA polymerase specialized sigma24 family protein